MCHVFFSEYHLNSEGGIAKGGEGEVIFEMLLIHLKYIQM